MIIVIIGWCLFAAAFIVALCLFLDRGELREQLKYANQRADRWEKEARDLGWKSEWEKTADALQDSLEKLNQAAAAMKKAAEAQQGNTEKLKQLAAASKDVNARLQAQNKALAQAKQCLDCSRKLLPAPRVTAAPVERESRQVGTLFSGSVGWAVPPKPSN